MTTNLTIELPLDLSITQVDNYLTANQDDATYQWYNCDTEEIVTGATGQSWWAFGLGNFACIITVGGCTDTTACVYVHTIGTEEIPFDQFVNIYPNPSNGQFTVELAQEGLEEMEMIISNSLGQVVLKQGLSKSAKVNLSDQAAGVYTISLTGEIGTLTKRIILK